MSNAPSADDRIVELESVVAHLQHDLDQFNSVILRQQAEIDGIKQMLSRLETRVEQSDSAPEVRDLEQERPPHY